MTGPLVDTSPERDNLERQFAQVLSQEWTDALPVAEAMKTIGLLIDYSSDLAKEEGIAKALQWSDDLAKKTLNDSDAVLLEYFRANAWTTRRRLNHIAQDSVWHWEQPELQNEILYLRRAIRHAGFESLDAVRKSQIYTNLGNVLSHIGRFVEAVRHWEEALKATPLFGMALGNLGLGLAQYARTLYDIGHKQVFLIRAHTLLEQATTNEAVVYNPEEYAHARNEFERVLAQIDAHLDVEAARRQISLEGFNLGRTQKEKSYRVWALSERLFLNPLNDIGPHTIAARDNLSLPDYVTPIGGSPTLTGFFNQMKQEYVSARWFLYESIQATKPHFSDRAVLLYNTLDYPSYSLAVERAKAAYRIAYSIFDKIAFFLNDYAKLEVPAKRVYFKTIWYAKQDPVARNIRPEFIQLANWPLRGLFWLSKDLFDLDFQDSCEPDAEDLYTIRNCLEHSYMKVHEIVLPATGLDDPFKDRLAHSIARDSFISKTCLILRRSRAALTYLSLGMHQEERRRAAERPARILSSNSLENWRDSWKV
jgi:tetratricopeptide (TPR) repeat protein